MLVDDAEGEAERLDAALAEAVGAYADPWREAERPIHPTQFTGSLAPAARREELSGGL